MATAISLHQVSFQLRNGQPLFSTISAQFSYRCQAIVGVNGVGKSVLGKIICDRLVSEQGSVLINGSVSYVPQQWEGDGNESVSQALGLSDPFDAMTRIEKGCATDEDFARAEPWWDWKKQLNDALAIVGFEDPIDLTRAMQSFSGGEQVRLLWAAALLQKTDWILFDEPTNHLDAAGRQQFNQWLRHTNKQCLLITHDRTLLNNVDAIFELTPKSMVKHVGNYDAYIAGKEARWKQQETDLALARREQKRVARKAQEALEKQQQRTAQGKATAEKRNWTKLERDAAKEAAQNTLKSQKLLRDNRKEQNQQRVEIAETDREWFEPIQFDLSGSHVAERKQVIELEQIQSGYTQPLHPPISARLQGPFRLHIKGKNGSGKSAFLKAVAGRESWLEGNSAMHVESCYMDQHFYRFNNDQTAVDLVLQHQPALNNQQARDRLALLRLRNVKADVPFGQLSGGEQLKVVLASQLLGLKPPQCLLLDEPTNHLDLDSLQALEHALKAYQGAMLVVSHDASFVTTLGITHELDLPNGTLTAL